MAHDDAMEVATNSTVANLAIKVEIDGMSQNTSMEMNSYPTYASTETDIDKGGRCIQRSPSSLLRSSSYFAMNGGSLPEVQTEIPFVPGGKFITAVWPVVFKCTSLPAAETIASVHSLIKAKINWSVDTHKIAKLVWEDHNFQQFSKHPALTGPFYPVIFAGVGSSALVYQDYWNNVYTKTSNGLQKHIFQRVKHFYKALIYMILCGNISSYTFAEQDSKRLPKPLLAHQIIRTHKSSSTKATNGGHSKSPAVSTQTNSGNATFRSSTKATNLVGSPAIDTVACSANTTQPMLSGPTLPRSSGYTLSSPARQLRSDSPSPYSTQLLAKKSGAHSFCDAPLVNEPLYSYVRDITGVVGTIDKPQQFESKKTSVPSFNALTHLYFQTHGYLASAQLIIALAYNNNDKAEGFVEYLANRGMAWTEAEFLWEIITNGP
ncbi:hypothetical protein B0H34DRAFT_860957 [Crassisporium funariophilum]|nr:hypothetical protein B0H34DRAFT_860957 [Crassisporium funariophilum]